MKQQKTTKQTARPDSKTRASRDDVRKATQQGTKQYINALKELAKR